MKKKSATALLNIIIDLNEGRKSNQKEVIALFFKDIF